MAERFARNQAAHRVYGQEKNFEKQRQKVVPQAGGVDERHGGCSIDTPLLFGKEPAP